MTEQQKFEAWASMDGALLYRLERNVQGYYASPDVETWWHAWQARASQDRSAELLKALEEVVAGLPEHWAAVKKARAAISKARGE